MDSTNKEFSSFSHSKAIVSDVFREAKYLRSSKSNEDIITLFFRFLVGGKALSTASTRSVPPDFNSIFSSMFGKNLSMTWDNKGTCSPLISLISLKVESRTSLIRSFESAVLLKSSS